MMTTSYSLVLGNQYNQVFPDQIMRNSTTRMARQRYAKISKNHKKGVRYTDDREIVWWTHQGSVRVDVRDADDQWTTKYSDLKEIKKGN